MKEQIIFTKIILQQNRVQQHRQNISSNDIVFHFNKRYNIRQRRFYRGNNVLPSIVAIDVTVTETSSDVFGRTYSQDATGSGSGIIVAQDSKYLYIATNNHVVSDATKVSVKFNDESVYDATVKGTDSDSDLCRG